MLEYLKVMQLPLQGAWLKMVYVHIVQYIRHSFNVPTTI